MGLNKTPLSYDSETAEFLRAADIEDDYLTLTIKSVSVEKIGLEGAEKPVVRFQESDKGLVLNKTNWRVIESITGENDTEKWVGTPISLYQSEVLWQGKPMPCLRVRQTLKYVSKF